MEEDRVTPSRFRFRVWDKDEKRMLVMPELIQQNWRFYDFEAGDIDECYILMQSTGILDKNGKEIFEGDIVKYWTTENGPHPATCGIASIVWDGICFAFKDPVEKPEWAERYSFWHPQEETFATSEAIGNIYENPELLQKNT